MTPETLAILTQKEIIALDQDSLCYQARRLRDDGDQELWAKPLGKIAGGDVAVVLLNRGSEAATISFDLDELGINASTAYAVRDLWKREALKTTSKDNKMSFEVPTHGVVALRIKGKPTVVSPFQK